MLHFSEKLAMQRFNRLVGGRHPFYLDPKYNLEALCKDLQTNRAYASRFINQTLGTTFPQLLRKLRLEYAERLSASFPKMSITDVALSCGFNNITSFRRAFFDHYGCTPSEHRKAREQEKQEAE